MQITLMALVRTEDELKAKLDSGDEIFDEFRERWVFDKRTHLHKR